MEIKLGFTEKEITPWAGMSFMRRFIERMDFRSILNNSGLPKQNSNRGYDPQQLIENFLVGMWCGATKFEHLEVTRQDKVMGKIFEWETMPGHKAFQRYFKKFNWATNKKVFTQLYQWFFRKVQFDNFTLDLDSSILTRYGEQEGAKVGYNKDKKGRKSHHPLMAFIADCKMVANFMLRSGDAYTSNNMYSFLEDTLERLEGKKIGLLRADSGFFDNKIMEYLENPTVSINYIISAKLYKPIKREILSDKVWTEESDGIYLSELEYKSPEWDKPRRLVIVKQNITKHPKATGKKFVNILETTGRLFEDEEIYKNYRYSCYVTNLDLPASSVWHIYNKRGDAENRIKELKYDFGFDSFNLKEFYATEAALNFVMMGYNIMSLFRQIILNTDKFQRMPTLRYKLFGKGGFIVKNGTERILKLSVKMKDRKWIRGLWGYSKEYELPFLVPN